MKKKILECYKQVRLSTTLAENAMTAAGEINQEYLYEILRFEIKYRNGSGKSHMATAIGVEACMQNCSTCK